MYAAFDVTALTKALKEAESFITALVEKETGLKPKGRMKWTTVNDTQVQLMRRFEAVEKDLSQLPELKAWAKETAEELNEILAQHGFTIRLEPWQKSPDKFGVVAIYDITIEWLVEGKVANEATGCPYKIPSNGKPAFRLDGKQNQIEFHRVNGRVVVKIPGKKTGDSLCFTKAERPLEQFDLLKEAEDLRRAMSWSTLVFDFGGVVMPNVVFDTKDSLKIDWLVDLYLTDAAGDNWYVTQAKMQAKFALGRKGARAKVAVTIGMTREAFTMPKPDYIADHDLIVWMERESVDSEPFFVAYVERGDFADHQVELDEIN